MNYVQKILAIIIVLILVYNIYINNKIFNDFLEGLWESTETFCNDSKIDGMLLYIGPVLSHFWVKRKAYLIMYANDVVIINKKFNISNMLMLNPIISDTVYLTFRLSDDKETLEVDDPSLVSIETIMPLTQDIEIDISKGRMVWKNDDTIYGEFIKNFNT